MPRIPTIEIREKIQIKPGETMKLDATVKNHDDKGDAPAVFFCQASLSSAGDPDGPRGFAVTTPNTTPPLGPGEKAHVAVALTMHADAPKASKLLLYVLAWRGDFDTLGAAHVLVTVK